MNDHWDTDGVGCGEECSRCYESFCASSWKHFDDKEKELLVIGIGCAGEAGEFADLLKKAVTYGKPVDREKAIKELGDQEYYAAMARRVLGISREEVINANVSKLKARHPNGFNSNAEAVKAGE